ncbi:hypothetical protein [Kutzneria buriramensis]|uniref:hypothetical protein n=1 Tax=Kutzneria buriramensis TaxID=1045776 RepID=UPI0014770C86|nr:hypothetical protein [Kutzneria buriramensis]
MSGRLVRPLLAVVVAVAGTVGIGMVAAPAASADPVATVLVSQPLQSWAPRTAGRVPGGAIGHNSTITISCYLTGDAVTGPYGTENIWDLVSGGQGTQPGVFVPDAQLYTGSNSAVVPRCSAGTGTIIGGSGGYVAAYSGPGTNYDEVVLVSTGFPVAFWCYASGTPVTGPYGTENTWDLLTVTEPGSQVWVPDADVYTGSNSPVVGHC